MAHIRSAEDQDSVPFYLSTAGSLAWPPRSLPAHTEHWSRPECRAELGRTPKGSAATVIREERSGEDSRSGIFEERRVQRRGQQNGAVQRKAK